jgi:hypothetical protein
VTRYISRAPKRVRAGCGAWWLSWSSVALREIPNETNEGQNNSGNGLDWEGREKMLKSFSTAATQCPT